MDDDEPPRLGDGFPGGFASDEFVEALYASGVDRDERVYPEAEAAALHALLATVVERIESTKFTFSNEADLQAGIAGALVASWPVEREVILDKRNRIDILVAGQIGIEVKVKGNAASAIQQVMRYCAFPSIAAMILVTTRSRSRHSLPLEIHGKPVRVVSLMGRGL